MVFGVFGGIFCMEQKCEFVIYSSRYYCEIKNANLIDENENVTTTTTNHLPNKTNADVQVVAYYDNSNNISFIPNSIFTTFPNIDYFSFRPGNNLKVLKPHFFKNAKKMTILHIWGNKIRKLEAKLFVEAKNLQRIYLERNEISSIDLSTFYGLNQLQYINLQINKIKFLHPKTFINLNSLSVLFLSGGENC